MSGYPSASDWSSFDANYICLGSETGQLAIYDIRSLGIQKPFALIKSNERLVRKVQFHPRGNLIAVASEDCTTQVYRLVNPSVQNDSDLQKM